MAIDPVPCEEEADLGTKLVGKVQEAKCEADAKKALRGMCGSVASMHPDSEPQGRYRFIYQRKLLQASCADPTKDSEEQIAKKINAVWTKNEDSLKCSGGQFDLDNGSIIKFAVNMKFDVFIHDVAKWKINLNKIDQADGKTVLDYVQVQIERNKGTANEPVLKNYYETLKLAGAKHKKDL